MPRRFILREVTCVLSLKTSMKTAAKQRSLDMLRAEILADTSLPLIDGTHLVFGEGDVDAKVLFIGEAPGKREDELGRPFVGRSGTLLDKQLVAIGLPRHNVYITNIVKRRPPDNRDPSPLEIEAYKPYLARQIEIIAPQIIATLGRFSMNYFLPDAKISRDHGQLFTLEKYSIFPLFHPAAAMRATRVMKDFEADFIKLKKLV